MIIRLMPAYDPRWTFRFLYPVAAMRTYHLNIPCRGVHSATASELVNVRIVDIFRFENVELKLKLYNY